MDGWWAGLTLGCIFDHIDAVALGDVAYGVHLAGHTRIVYGADGSCALCDGGLDQTLCAVGGNGDIQTDRPDRQTGKQINKQTDRQTDRQIDRQIDR